MSKVLWCSDCNSQRPGVTCWKCGAETFVPASAWPLPETFDFDVMRGFAVYHGFQLVSHGSGERDQDIIAIPWTDTVVLNPIQFAYGLAKYIGGRVVDQEIKPHSRFACNILVGYKYKLIDLSVVPPNLKESK